MLYPLKFNPIYKDKIWGGEKIRSFLKKDFSPLPNCGESWELSGVKENISTVRNGTLKGRNLVDLIDTHKGRLVGERIYRKFKSEFPLLIKFLDANEDLSIQVHPNDTLARARHDSFGKTEMWYVIHAEKGAKLISGFNQPLTKEKYLAHFNQGRIKEVLNIEMVVDDDVFFIPAGRVHTIGKGLLVAEIQQTSDVTYRIYDFDRKDSSGKKRDLHINESLDAIDYQYYDHYKTVYSDKLDEPAELVACEYFTTNKLILTKKINREFSNLDSFVVYICLDGIGKLYFNNDFITIEKGEVVLVPSEINQIDLVPEGELKLLETFVT